MSIKGEIEAKCPKGCEPFTADVYSFIRGDKSPELRLAVLFRECNMLLCPECEKPFFPDAPYVYHDPTDELVAFVFPEAYRDKEAFWRGKMAADFAEMQKVLGSKLPLSEPEIFFGNDDLACLLESEDYRAEETEVMEAVAQELGLALYRVSPLYARRQGIPRTLPFTGKSASSTSVVAGLEKVLAVNDRLTAYAAYLSKLREGAPAALPPASVSPG